MLQLLRRLLLQPLHWLLQEQAVHLVIPLLLLVVVVYVGFALLPGLEAQVEVVAPPPLPLLLPLLLPPLLPYLR